MHIRDKNMEEDVEVIFESWLLKYTGFEKQRSVRLSSAWKKRYFVLLRRGNQPVLHYYEKKPKSLDDCPKEKISLNPWFKLERHNGPLKGREFVCEITTQSKQLCLAADDEKLFHLFMFFTQTQRKMIESLENECYVVRPDNSEDHRKLGSRGSMCLLHISKFGVTLAIQLSKCVLAQWPLRAIKSYESTGRGQFMFDAGRRGPNGSGLYVFNTRAGQDNIMYDHLDKYVMELAGLKQIVSARSSKPVVMETIEDQHSSLLTLTEVCSDARFTAHLRKISRDIYDHLLQHIGGSTMSRLNASNPDLLADSQHTFNRTTSTPAVEINSGTVPRMVRRSLPENRIHNTSITNNTGAIPKQLVVNHERQDSQLSTASIDSQYLHMNSTPEPVRVSQLSQNSNSSRSSDWYMNTPTKTPPAGYDLAKHPGLAPIGEHHHHHQPHHQQQQQHRRSQEQVYRGEIQPEDKPDDEYILASDTSTASTTRYVQRAQLSPGAATSSGGGQSDFQLLRQQSRSAEDLSEYMRMSMHNGIEVPVQDRYDNGGFRISDEMAGLSAEEAMALQPWLYSYASPKHTRGGHSLDSNDPYSPAIIGRPPRLSRGSLHNPDPAAGPPPGSSPPVTDGFATLPSKPYKYSKPNKQFRKSRSIPNLIDSAGADSDLNSTRSSNLSLDKREEMAKVFVRTRRAQEQQAHAQAAQGAAASITDRRKFAGPNLALMTSSPESAAFNRTYGYGGGDDVTDFQAATPKSSVRRLASPDKVISPMEGGTGLSPTTPTTMKGIHVSSKTKVFTKQPSQSSQFPDGGGGGGHQVAVNSNSLVRRKDSAEHPMQGRRLPSLPPQDATIASAALQRGFKPDKVISETTC